MRGRTRGDTGSGAEHPWRPRIRGARLARRAPNAAAASCRDASGKLQLARTVAAAVVDPEIPVLTLEDLGVLRGVEWREGRLTVLLTPTYVGCPATSAIAVAVGAALAEAGLEDASVAVVLSPPWTSDDISPRGRRRLRAFGIAPPVRGLAARARFADAQVACPRCGATATVKISEFGSTPCKALWRCKVCAEPFDYFKCL
jgi:ring-1,2-phenylacetyl-CoA epoxidase subunit PaaD